MSEIKNGAMKNTCNINGYVFKHELQHRTYGPTAKNPGGDYINGRVWIAVGEDSLNTVEVNFSFVNPTKKNYKTGETVENTTYTYLDDIIKNKKTIEEIGKVSLTPVDIFGSVEVNDFVASNGDLVAQQRIKGMTIKDARDKKFTGRCDFELDVFMTNYRERETNDGRIFGEISGYAFNFFNELVPVKLAIQPETTGGMDYFESLHLSTDEPVFTKLNGSIVCSTVVYTREVDNAFGPSTVDQTRTLRSWNITRAAGTPYEIGDDDEDKISLTFMKNCLEARDKKLAEIVAREEEKKSVNNFAAPVAAPQKAEKKAAPAMSDFEDFGF